MEFLRSIEVSLDPIAARYDRQVRVDRIEIALRGTLP